MKKRQLTEWVHQLVNESNVEVVKEIQLGEATVRLGKNTDANFHQAGGGLIVQLISNAGSVGLDKRDVRALIGYIKKMMGYSYMPRLKNEGKKIGKTPQPKDFKGDMEKYLDALNKHMKDVEKSMKEDIELGKVYTDKDNPPFQTNEQKLNERVVALPSGIKADLDTLKGLTIFTLKGKPIKFDRQQLAMLLRSIGKFMGLR